MSPAPNPLYEEGGNGISGESSSSFYDVETMKYDLHICSLSDSAVSDEPSVLKETSPKLERTLTESTVAASSDGTESNETKTSTSIDAMVSSTTIGPQKCVSFDKVQIRFYPIIMGDNPCCSSLGPPIQLDFNYFKQVDYTVDKYESQRQPRRTDSELKISGWIRKKMIKRCTNHTNEEISDRILEMCKINDQRKQTVRRAKFQQGVTKSFSKVFRSKR
mmetsp:Transcript_5250/g.7712  ORF Transcript_5250/g.7712 Transcript_5250/m.7712 type:complete len:219 (-) Transcript_5250:26-682(-)